MRIEMRTLAPDESVGVFQWFVHRCDAHWFITINEFGDRLRSLPVELSSDSMERPAALAAKLWPVLSSQDVDLHLGSFNHTYLQSEIRVKAAGRRCWYQASAWLWQDARVIAYRSHPVISSRAVALLAAPAEELAQPCFDLAAALEAS